MNSIADGSVSIQTTSRSVPSTPSWFGEGALIVEHLRKQGVLSAICERVRFARGRFGHYEVIDFLAVLFGYAISGERTLEDFYEGLQPFAVPFMALFDRDRLPARSTLSRFLTALTEAPVEALRALFLDDLLSRPLSKERQTGGLVDREGFERVVFDVDGTREAARQRALPQTEELPPAFRRLDKVCAAGYTGRKRGEVVRTRTVVSQAHSYQWLGSFGNRGNGLYRAELRQVLSAIGRYLTAHQLPQERARLAARWALGHRGRAGGSDWLLVRDARQRGRRAGSSSRPGASAPAPRSAPASDSKASVCAASTTARMCLWDPRACIAAWWWRPIQPATRRAGWASRVRASSTNSSSPRCREPPFTASAVVELYLHRGAFETALADEDQEQATSRWCSHSAAGQELWQVISQWVWNLRLELGHQLHPSGRDFVPQPDGTLRCPAGQPLRVHERRREADGSLRVVYAASVRSCRPCPLREQCQWQGRATTKPRQVSMLLHPLVVGSAPLRLRVTGIVGTIDGRAYNCSVSNTWRCRESRASLPAPRSRLRPCPVRSGRSIVSTFKSGWPAMRVPQQLAGW